MKKNSLHIAIFLLVGYCMPFTSLSAFTLQGRITHARSNQAFLHSSWGRRDTLVLDAQGYFRASITHSPYEKVFDLQWVTKDGHGRYLNMLVDPTDIVNVEANDKKEKLDYLQGNRQRKNYLFFLLENTSGLDHRLPGLADKQRDAANRDIFRYLDTLFIKEPWLAVECIGFMRYNLFNDDFRWAQMPRIWAQFSAVPDSIKIHSKIYQELNTHFWPGKTMKELMFQDPLKNFHHTDEFRDKPLLLIFENANPASHTYAAAFLPHYTKLKEKLHVLSLTEDPYFKDWLNWINQHPYPWAQGFWVADETMSSLQLLEYFHGSPHSVLLDQNRKIIEFNPAPESIFSLIEKK